MTVTNNRRRSRLMLDIDVDERTEGMSDQALFCRKRGHKWVERGMSRKRYNELIAAYMMEDDMFCENGCGATWLLVYSTRTGQVLENKRQYPKTGDYLMPKGAGRLDRSAARLAYLARRGAQYR